MKKEKYVMPSYRILMEEGGIKLFVPGSLTTRCSDLFNTLEISIVSALTCCIPGILYSDVYDKFIKAATEHGALISGFIALLESYNWKTELIGYNNITVRDLISKIDEDCVIITSRFVFFYFNEENIIYYSNYDVLLEEMLKEQVLYYSVKYKKKDVDIPIEIQEKLKEAESKLFSDKWEKYFINNKDSMNDLVIKGIIDPMTDKLDYYINTDINPLDVDETILSKPKIAVINISERNGVAIFKLINHSIYVIAKDIADDLVRRWTKQGNVTFRGRL